MKSYPHGAGGSRRERGRCNDFKPPQPGEIQMCGAAAQD